MANFNFNKVILGGRLTADIELKQTPNGVPVCSFSLAVNRKHSKDSEAQTDFINCVAWRNAAEFISRYFKKGSSLCVVGSVQTRNWTDNNGQKRYATEVIVDEALFVDSKTEGETQGTTTYANALGSIAPKAEEFTDLSESDDLPF
jgi:single-strand DNA-binding protein